MKYLIDAHLGIGDLVHVLPLIETIEENDNSAEIDIVIAFHEQEILFHQFKSIITTMTVSEILLRGFYHSKGYDYGMITACVFNQYKSFLMLKVMRCQQIVKSKNRTVHRVVQNLALASQIDFYVKKDITPKLRINDDMKITPRKQIGICMGGYGKNGKDYKRWSYINWVSLINEIDELFEIVLIAGTKEAIEFELYENLINRTYVNLMGKTVLEETCIALKHCYAVIGNDTGIMHIAGALDIPTITLYGPTNPEIVGVYSNKASAIIGNMECCPCYVLSKKIKCKLPVCMNTITIENVIQELRKLLVL